MKELVDNLRDRLSDVDLNCYSSDLVLQRWIEGCNRDLDSSEHKIRKHLHLRTILRLDKAPNLDPIMEDYFPRCSLEITTGKDNSLVRILAFGKLDCYGFRHSLKVSSFLTSFLWIIEQDFHAVLKQEELSGMRSGITYIMDLSGATLNPWTTSSLSTCFPGVASLLTSNYVELVSKILIVNGGQLMNSMWKLIEQFVPKAVRNKIHTLGGSWKSEILEHVDENSLPTHWGGTLTGPSGDHLCAPLVFVPTPIPTERFYDPSKEQVNESLIEYKVIPCQSAHIVSYQTPTVPIEIRWYFKVDGEIKFAIYKTDKPPPSESAPMSEFDLVHPKLILSTPYIPEFGSLVCEDMGWYHLEFENQHPTCARTVKYCIKLRLPSL